MRTLDQERAEFAWERVSKVDQSIREKYRNLAKGIPALVMTNGLMQTLAFLEAKGQKAPEHKTLLDDLRTWLAGQKAGVLLPDTNTFQQVMAALVGMDTLAYQRATEETQAILRWIRQLADTV